MAKGTSKTLIGGFVVGAVALLIIAVVIFGSGALFSKKITMVMFFKESVSGLNVGAPVVFQGVTIGSVVKVEIWAYPKEVKMVIPVYVEIDPTRLREKGDGGIRPGSNLKRLVEKGLRAQLKMQSMVTGQMMIYVDFFPDKPIRLVGADPRYAEVPTIPSGAEQIIQALEKVPIQEIVLKATKTIDGIEKLVNSPEIKEAIGHLNGTLKSAEKVAQKLDGGVDKSIIVIQDVRKLVQDLDARIEPLSVEIQNTLTDSRQLIRDADSQIIPLSNTLKTTLEESGKTLAEARETLRKASAAISGESVISAEFINTLDEMNRTMRSIQSLTEFLKQHPDALLRGKKPNGGK